MWSHCMAPSPWTTLWCPMAFQGKKNQETVKLALPAVPWVTGFFVSDSGISSQNPCNCVGYLVNSLEGGKMNSFWYGNNMQTMNDFSLSLVLYNAIYVFWALIFSFGNLHKNLCLKKIMLRIKWGVMWAAETISYSPESILSFLKFLTLRKEARAWEGTMNSTHILIQVLNQLGNKADGWPKYYLNLQ